MKYLLLSLVSFCFLFCTTLYSQTISNSKIETFKVWGNCGMCKKNIEKAVKESGSIEAVWNKSTKIITVTFDSTITTTAIIHKKIADAGYDTSETTADEEAYSNLHKCCRYERKKNE